MIKKIIVCTIILCFSKKSLAQNESNSFCNEVLSDNFFPETYLEKKIKWKNAFYVEKKKSNKTIDGNKYNVLEQTFNNGNVYKIYLSYRDGVVYEYNYTSNSEFIRYSDKFKLNYEWGSSDNNKKFKIKSFNSKLTTPFCEYTNLLELEIKYLLSGKKYSFFYKKGIGYVGAKENGEIISYLFPNKDEVDFILPKTEDCLHLKNNKELNKCNIAFIQNHIFNRVIIKMNDNEMIRGKYLIKIKINTKGFFENFTVLKSPKGSDVILNKIKDMILSLPKIIPSEVSFNSKKVSSYLKVPFIIE